MSKEELEKLIDEALVHFSELEAAYHAAEAAYSDEMERDSRRGPGSDAQERRREEHQEHLRRLVEQAKQALHKQEMIIADLRRRLASL